MWQSSQSNLKLDGSLVSKTSTGQTFVLRKCPHLTPHTKSLIKACVLSFLLYQKTWRNLRYHASAMNSCALIVLMDVGNYSCVPIAYLYCALKVCTVTKVTIVSLFIISYVMFTCNFFLSQWIIARKVHRPGRSFKDTHLTFFHLGHTNANLKYYLVCLLFTLGGKVWIAYYFSILVLSAS